MSYKESTFQWYNNGIKTVKPSGNISLEQFVNAVRSPKPEMIKAFEEIAKAGKEGNKKLKDELKTKHLFFTTPSVDITGGIRNYDSIKSFSEFCVLEYDGIEHATVLRDYIFEKMPSCIFAFTSPSLTGSKFIFRIQQPKSIEEYKQFYFGIASDLDKFKNLDISNERCVLPLFNSYDPEAKFRENAIPSTKRGYKVNAFIPFESSEVDLPEDVDPEDVSNCFNLIGHLIDRINDQGHNQVVSTSFTASGLCAYYGIPQDDMWDLLEEKIRNNSYLNKGTEGYLKTAKTLFNKGSNFPTALKRKDE